MLAYTRTRARRYINVHTRAHTSCVLAHRPICTARMHTRMCTRTQCTAHKDLCTHAHTHAHKHTPHARLHTCAHTGTMQCSPTAHPCAHPHSTLAHAHVQAHVSLTQLWSPRPVPWPSRLVWLGLCRGRALTPRQTRDLGTQDSSELLFSQGRVSPRLQHLPGPVCVETGEQQPPSPGWGCCWARLWEAALLNSRSTGGGCVALPLQTPPTRLS